MHIRFDKVVKRLTVLIEKDPHAFVNADDDGLLGLVGDIPSMFQVHNELRTKLIATLRETAERAAYVQ